MRLNDHSEEVAQAPNVLGVQSLTTSEYVIRIAVECSPSVRTSVERQIQMYAKEALEEMATLRLTSVTEN
ncbi:hypothetical protein D3C71_1959860 [compost metagenome]